MGLQQTSTHQGKNQSELQTKSGIVLLIIGIIFIGANLRAPITSVGPLIASIRDSLGISNATAGTLTTVPLIAFALLSPFASTFARRFGMEMVLLLSLILLTIGIVLRPLAGVGTLFTGTILVGLAIAVCNVLLPSVIKQSFPQNLGIMTGVYSVSMNLCGAIASGLSVPVASLSKFGWHGSLGYWSIFAMIAVLFWIPQIRFRHKPTVSQTSAAQKSVSMWRSRLAWQVTFFMGLQSLIFYTVVAWLPEILQQQGVSSNVAGWMLSLIQFAVLPFTFIVPILAGRMRDQRLLVVITAILLVVGTTGIIYGGTVLMPLWVIMIGIGAGSAFSVAMMFFNLRTQTTHEAAELSGMAQSFGYLLAAIGPILFGALHDLTHNWTLPLWMLIIASILILVFGYGAGKKKYVSS
ncbi:CP family cyanate transporter-like MFS transporter [Scopulibacillus darangshiensis]|uniref:CP family cyanate transporter-like MFS transporter n=1 Tax=Scopulibacillus darangshiensis TaxID=442528 RepID=A0A4R2P915_9BACL|nr:MFS transporter [Scopulibacillus darangshiensis]TCP30828.1 CP family cyanate transporter-like MFS transporter [Scopulibacillus darangshiensis]